MLLHITILVPELEEPRIRLIDYSSKSSSYAHKNHCKVYKTKSHKCFLFGDPWKCFYLLKRLITQTQV